MTEEEKKKDLAEKITEGVRGVFESTRWKGYLKAMSLFHSYSPRNTLLIYLQKEDATRVAGYAAWKKLNRYVKKGEKGIAVYAPCLVKEKRERPVLDGQGKPVLLPDGEKKTEVKNEEFLRFRVAYVFDVSQTEGEPLPTLCEELNGERSDWKCIFEAAGRMTDYQIRFAQIPGSAKGFCDPETKEIVLRFGMSDEQTIKTLLHELTHARLHEKETGSAERQRIEIEAESTAFLLCDSLGLNTSEYSFEYLASWSRDMELPELKDILENIQESAAALCAELNEALEAVIREQADNLPPPENSGLQNRLEAAQKKSRLPAAGKEVPEHERNPIH